MNFVLDASLTMAFVFRDEANGETDKVLDLLAQGSKAFTLPLWHWEVANLLIMAERRKRITAAETNRHLTHLRSLPIRIDEDASGEAWSATLLLARRYDLTAYDAAYLELAIRLGLPLGSLDSDLRAAARSEGAKVLPRSGN